jgi:hypothetical protein
MFDFDSMGTVPDLWALLAEKVYSRFCQRYKFLALDLSLAIGCHLLVVQFIRSLKSNLHTAVTQYHHRK